MSGYIFNFNSYTLENSDHVNIDQVEGLTRVEIRRSEDYVTGADGGNIWETRKGMRVISIYGSVYANDLPAYYALRKSIQTAFNNDIGLQVLTITRSDGQQVSILAQVVELPEFKEVAGEFAEATFNIVLKCPDPYFVDATETELTLAPGAGGGTSVSSPVPSPVGLIGGSLIIVNDGDVEVTPRFKIDGQITNATPYNSTTGGSFAIENTIQAGEFVQAYMDNQGPFVLFNGVSNWFQFKYGDIWSLAKGSNVITFNGSSFDANALLTISYRLKYLSI